MKATTELRFLRFMLCDNNGEHAAAQIIQGTCTAIVLQQKFVEVYAFSEEPVPDGRVEWRDVKIFDNQLVQPTQNNLGS